MTARDAATARTMFDGAETEKAWQDKIMQAARLLNWSCHHVFDSRRSEAGWPDIVCLRLEADGTARAVVIECKTARGRVRGEQLHWLDLFGALPGVVVAMIARPNDRDWRRVVEALGGEAT